MTSISEKVAVGRLAVLLLRTDQRQILLGFVLLRWQRSADFGTRALGLGVLSRPVNPTIFEFPAIRLSGMSTVTA